MMRRPTLQLTSAVSLLLACSSMSCATWMGKRGNEAATSAGVCRDPSEAERRALAALMVAVLPVDGSTGRSLDMAPGDPLPEGVIPAKRPDLFGAAQWATGVYCRCFEERCKQAEASAPAPEVPK